MQPSFELVSHLADVQEQHPTYLALGSFDGVHLGHQALLKQLISRAKQAGVRSAVLTFSPHPRRVIQQLSDRYYITTLDDRLALLRDIGIDLVINHPFDENVRQMRAADFVDRLLTILDMRQLWGGDFSFGYQREGTIPFLRHLGVERGFTVETMTAMVAWKGALVSSSRIRQSLSLGDVADVQGCLGRPFTLSGTVVAGDQRGRTIGFPTANLATWSELLLPANGVYATFARVDGKRYLSATNIGVRPTVNGRYTKVETHLLDFEGDLYGKSVQLEFCAYIRPEKKFPSLEALKTQIQLDVTAIKHSLQ